MPGEFVTKIFCYKFVLPMLILAPVSCGGGGRSVGGSRSGGVKSVC